MIRANYCRTCGPGNFGDQLTPALLEAVGIEVEWARPAEAQLFGVGSIASKIPDGFTGWVFGTGLIREGVRSPDLRRAKVLAIRGPATRRACRLPRSVPMGDPGILIGELVPAGRLEAIRGGELVELMVVPHYVDRSLTDRWPGATRLPITSPVVTFIEGLAAAREVVTSSLHGLIAADALGIPHRLEPHPRVIGGMWKFADYAGSFGPGVTSIEPGELRLTPRGAMAERQAELGELLHRLAREVG